MPKPIAGDVVIAYLNHELMAQRLPLAGALGRPPARPARRIAGEAGGPSQRLEPSRERFALLRRDRGGETDVVEQAVPIEQSEQQRADQPAARPVSESAHDAVGGAHALDLAHRPLAAFIRTV